MGLGRKTKTRVENLIAWVFAIGIILMLFVLIYYAMIGLGLTTP